MTNMELMGMEESENEETLKGKYLIFKMDNEEYGLEIKYVTEIIGIQPITQVPEMPAYIKGVTNLRGKIIPVMDARLRFKKKTKKYDDRTCIIVLEANTLSIGLIVDGVEEVVLLREEDIAEPPEMGKGGHRFLKGIGKAEGSVKLLLDCQRLLTEEEADELGAIV